LTSWPRCGRTRFACESLNRGPGRRFSESRGKVFYFPFPRFCGARSGAGRGWAPRGYDGGFGRPVAAGAFLSKIALRVGGKKAAWEHGKVGARGNRGTANVFFHHERHEAHEGGGKERRTSNAARQECLPHLFSPRRGNERRTFNIEHRTSNVEGGGKGLEVRGQAEAAGWLDVRRVKIVGWVESPPGGDCGERRTPADKNVCPTSFFHYEGGMNVEHSTSNIERRTLKAEERDWRSGVRRRRRGGSMCAGCRFWGGWVLRRVEI